MAFKVFALVFLALVAHQATGASLRLTELNLNAINLSHVSSAWFPLHFSIHHGNTQTLLSCHIIFPSGVTYEAFPNTNFPDAAIGLTLSSPQVCGLTYQQPPSSAAGTYQLISVTDSPAGQVLTRQSYIVTITQSEVVFPNDQVIVA